MGAAPIERDRHFLMPGDTAMVSGNGEILTVLGSCVAVILMDRHRSLAAMAHYVLPLPLENLSGKDARYGCHAIQEIVDRMTSAGSRMHELEAEIHGGADVLTGVPIGKSVGEGNIDLAVKQLR